MIKTLFAGLFFLLPVTVLACPNSHAALNNNKPPYTLIIVGVFVLVTYIPYYILFRATKKYDPKNYVLND